MSNVNARITHGLLVLVLLALVSLIGMLATGVRGGPLDPPGAPTSSDSVRLPGTPISSTPFTASIGGNYYLTRNLIASGGNNGITIASSGVTLDLNGFALTVITGGLDGILVSGTRQNVTIRNGTIFGWGGDGIDAATASRVTIEDVHVSTNGEAGIRAGADAIISNCHVANNGARGIEAGDRAVVRACTASDNSFSGIQVGERSIVESSTAHSNAAGIDAGQHSRISNCVATNNDSAGITASNSSVEDCVSNVNGGGGILVTGAGNVTGCEVRANTGVGISVGSESLVQGNAVTSNSLDGILVSDVSLVLDNVAAGHSGDAGIHATGLGNHIEGNTSSGAARGFDVDSPDNTIISNSAYGNTTPFDVVAGNAVGPIVTDANVGTNTNPSANYVP